MSKINILFCIILSSALAPLTAMGVQGERVKAGMVIELDDLYSVSTSSSWELIIEEGRKAELIIESVSGRECWVDYSGGDLKLGSGASIGLNLKRSRAVLRIPSLSADLNASSSSDIIVDMPLESEGVLIKSSSSGTVEIRELRTRAVELRVSSSSAIRIDQIDSMDLSVKGSSSGRVFIEKGETESLNTSLSSSSRFLAEEMLVLRTMDVRGSSSSFQEFGVTDGIEAAGNLSSSARLILHGDPAARALQSIKTSSSGGYRIK